MLIRSRLIVIFLSRKYFPTNRQLIRTGAGIVGFILMIIIGGIGGFIWGAIVAVIYNIILGAIGGIEMDLEVKG